MASLSLNQAHTRMREAGLRSSTLGTSRSGVGYKVYRRLGYEDTGVFATALPRGETIHRPTRLYARLAGSEGYELIKDIFRREARSYLGFAWRHTPFAPYGTR